jgi:hypothetical protein
MVRHLDSVKIQCVPETLLHAPFNCVGYQTTGYFAKEDRGLALAMHTNDVDMIEITYNLE